MTVKNIATMTWEQIDKDWAGLEKKHRMEISQAVARYCVGHSISEVAKCLGYSREWVKDQLEFAGIQNALGDAIGADALAPLTGGMDSKNVNRDKDRLIKEFAPTAEDSEVLETFVDHYREEGQSEDIAKRLGKAEFAAAQAIEAGVIKESTNKKNKKVNQILFPEDAEDTFELNLKHHMAKVKAAARFLDEAKVTNLRKLSTCEKVTEANEMWDEQIARILNFHPTFK